MSQSSDYEFSWVLQVKNNLIGYKIHENSGPIVLELVVWSDEQDIPVSFLHSLDDEGEKFRRSSMQLHDRH